MELEQLPEDWQRALLLMAHPDDPEYGTALVVNRWSGQGKEIRYVLASSGEAGIEGMHPEQAGPLREEEQRGAIARVGAVSVDFLGIPDGRIEYGLDLRRTFAGVIRKYRPEVVLTQTTMLSYGPYRNSADHRAVGMAALDAVSDASNSWIFPDLEGEPWSGVKHVVVFSPEGHTHQIPVSPEDVSAAEAALCEHRAYFGRLSDEPVESQAREIIEMVTQGKPHIGVQVYV